MRIRKIFDYIGVLKPRESGLLTFIGACSAFIAGNGQLGGQLFFIILTICIACAGANGLTNYIDREVDARVKRTQGRALPARLIYPPEKVLPLTIGLVVVGLALAFTLHWFCFLTDLVCTGRCKVDLVDHWDNRQVIVQSQVQVG